MPVVYPAGWAFFGGRYAIRLIVGKRAKVNVNELIKGAEKRKEIYYSLELFDTSLKFFRTCHRGYHVVVCDVEQT